MRSSEAVDLTRLLTVRAGHWGTRVRPRLAGAKVGRLSRNSANLGCALVLKSDVRRVIRAITATKRARRDILLGVALRVEAGDTSEIGLEVDNIPLDVGDLGAADHAKGVAALIGVLPLLGDQYIGIRVCGLLVANITTLSGTDACPVLCPERCLIRIGGNRALRGDFCM